VSEWRLRTSRNVVHGSPCLGPPQSCVVFKQISRQTQNGIICACVAGRCQSYRTESAVAKGTHSHILLCISPNFGSVTIDFLGILSTRSSAAMPRTSRRGTRCLQYRISSRRIQSSTVIRFGRSIFEVSVATDLGTDIPTIARDETRRIPIRRHIRGRSRVARSWTVQGGRWCVGGRAHHRFVQLEIERLCVLRSVQRVLGAELSGQGNQLHATGSRYITDKSSGIFYIDSSFQFIICESNMKLIY